MSHTIPIKPVERYAGKAAAIKRPKEIACFSYDENHEYKNDDSSLNYYYPPTIGADLSAGFDDFDKLDETGDDHLDSLLRTIMEKEKATGEKVEADVITWRGMMTKIMGAPFDKFNEFEMNATNFQGTIYIEEDHGAKLASREQQSRQRPRPGAMPQELMMYWGYKFEALSLLPEPWEAIDRDYIEARETLRVSNKAQYCSIVKTGIGNSTLVLGGEVDAVWDRKPEDPEEPINWVELKTAEEPRSDFDMLKFERKLCKFWIQSFLLGVPKIIVGFRSPDGFLLRLEELEVQKLPGQVKRVGKRSWDGNTCINFAAAFLDFLRKTVVGQGVWRIRARKDAPEIEVFKIQETGHGEILLKDYVDWKEKQLALEVAGML